MCWPVHGTNRSEQRLNLGCTQECRRMDLVYEQCRPIFATMHPPLLHWLWVHSWKVDRGSNLRHHPLGTLLGRRRIENPTVSSSVVERVPTILSPTHCPHRHEAPIFLDQLNCRCQHCSLLILIQWLWWRNNRNRRTKCNPQWQRSTIQWCRGPHM